MPASSLPPLRLEPAPPLLLEQDAKAQGATDIAETALWCYRLRYWHEHVAQDEVLVTASFNSLPAADESLVATDDMPPRVDYRFSARFVYSDDGERVHALRLVREPDEPENSGPWPYAHYHTSEGLVVELGNGAGEGSVRTYALDPPLPSRYSQTIDLTWCGLNVAVAQNACASLAAVRNRGLDSEDASEDDFVYRTPTVYASGVVAPANRWSQDFDISHLGDSVDAALDAVFTALFGQRRIGQRVKMEVRYGYLMSSEAGPDAGPMVYLPVGVYLNQPITAETVMQIALMLSAWTEANNPVPTRAEWLFSLAQFSQFDARAPHPLLDLAKMVYRLP